MFAGVAGLVVVGVVGFVVFSSFTFTVGWCLMWFGWFVRARVRVSAMMLPGDLSCLWGGII